MSIEKDVQADNAQSKVRSVLALLPDEAAVASCLDCAKAAADPFGAHVQVVHLGFDAVKAFASPEEIDIHQLLTLHEGSPEQRREKVRQRFEAWMAAAGRPENMVWKDEQGDIGALVADVAKTADLVVMARPAGADGSDAFHSVLFRSHRLLLVAPRDPARSAPLTYGHIVLGWKPSDPVRHAAEQALPWLRQATKISVVSVQNGGHQSYAQDARNWFGAAGLVADFTSIEKREGGVGTLLLDEAKRLGGDCLLIGAFARGEFWEALLGGVTRDVLAAARIPVFMMS